MKQLIAICAGVLLSAAAWAQNPPPSSSYEAATHFFDYDATAPMNFKDKSAEDVRGIKVHDVEYASPKGGAVPAYLVVPPGKGPFAAIIFVHWGQADRTEFLSEAVMLARAGAESLLIDGVFNRPNGEGDDFAAPEKERAGYIQLVTDVRRGVDFLRTRPEVDPRRIAYVGHSYGATWAGAIAGVEKRIKAYVLMGGLPTLAEFPPDSFVGQYTLKTHSKPQIEKYQQVMSQIAPMKFVGHAAPATLLFQFAQHDRYITPHFAKEYFDAASQPKIQKWYYCSHEFNDPASLLDRDQFLRDQLGLRPIVPIILERMGMKVSPGIVVGRQKR